MKTRVIILLILSLSLYGQKKEENKFVDGYSFTSDKKLVEKYNPKFPLWVPTLEIIASNLILGSYNKYVTKSGFAQISFSSIKENFKVGWGWDADNFFTNMWGHPFQGSVYFNSARSNGYGYWTSLAMSTLGSLQWEYFMEIEHPSINDLLMTSLQGAIFGEVFYRISSLIIDETTSYKRVWRELAVAGFNPSRALNRAIYGRSYRFITDKLYDKKPYIFNVVLGVNNHFNSEFYETQKRRYLLGIKYFYGDTFEQSEYNPLDIFTLDMELQFEPKLSIVKFKIYGVLMAKSFNLSKHQNEFNFASKFIFGIFQYTDYLQNDVFKLAALNIGPGINYLSPSLFWGSRIIFSSTLSFMPMGAINSDYAKQFIPENFEVGRDYNLSSGYSSRTDIMFVSKFFFLKFAYNLWSFWTIQGADGREYIHILEPALFINLHRRVRLGFELLLYYRKGKYDNLPNIYIKDQEARGFILVSF